MFLRGGVVRLRMEQLLSRLLEASRTLFILINLPNGKRSLRAPSIPCKHLIFFKLFLHHRTHSCAYWAHDATLKCVTVVGQRCYASRPMNNTPCREHIITTVRCTIHVCIRACHGIFSSSGLLRMPTNKLGSPRYNQDYSQKRNLQEAIVIT